MSMPIKSQLILAALTPNTQLHALFGAGLHSNSILDHAEAIDVPSFSSSRGRRISSLQSSKFSNWRTNKTRHDWINQIYKDIQDVGIIFSLEEIQRLSEGNFNAHVKLCIRRRALEWLNSEKNYKSEVVEHSELLL